MLNGVSLGLWNHWSIRVTWHLLLYLIGHEMSGDPSSPMVPSKDFSILGLPHDMWWHFVHNDFHLWFDTQPGYVAGKTVFNTLTVHGCFLSSSSVFSTKEKVENMLTFVPWRVININIDGPQDIPARPVADGAHYNTYPPTSPWLLPALVPGRSRPPSLCCGRAHWHGSESGTDCPLASCCNFLIS